MARPLEVCVYGSSSKSTPEAYLAAARVLGAELARPATAASTALAPTA